jgi:hypothetical protein
LEKTLTNSFSHVQKLKDVKTLKITKNLESSADHATNDLVPLIICPITKMELNGHHPFVAIWTTGFVLSEKAIKEVGIDSLQEEYGPFQASDLIRLLPLEHEVDDLRAAMHYRRQASKSSKKSSDGSKKKGSAEGTDGKEASSGGDDISGKKRKSDETSSSNPATFTQAPKPKLSKTDKLVTTASSIVKEAGEKSEVYKNLFHKDNEKDRKDKDLFMTVAGLRYTLN